MNQLPKIARTDGVPVAASLQKIDASATIEAENVTPVTLDTTRSDGPQPTSQSSANTPNTTPGANTTNTSMICEESISYRRPPSDWIQAMARWPILPPYHSAEESATGRRSTGPSNISNPPSLRMCTWPDSGSIAANRIHRFSTTCFSDGLALTTFMRRSGVVSTTNRIRTASWISTICHGNPVRRSLAWPSITPTRPATLWGSFVPHP